MPNAVRVAWSVEGALLTNIDVTDLAENPRREEKDEARNGTSLAACAGARNCVAANKTIQHWLLPRTLDDVDDDMLVSNLASNE
jgi:hypothetical protein